MTYKIIVSSTSKNSLTLYLKYLNILFKKQGIQLSCFSLPTSIKRISLLKSPHVYKKAKETFEIRNYKRLVCFYSNLNVNNLFLNKPKSIFLKVNYQKK